MNDKEKEILIDSLRGTLDILNDSIVDFENKLADGKVDIIDWLDYEDWKSRKIDVLNLIDKLEGVD